MFGQMLRSHGELGPASFVFNGIDEYLTAPILSSAMNRRVYTVSAWLKMSAMPNFSKIIFEMGRDNSNYLVFLPFNPGIQQFQVISENGAFLQFNCIGPDTNYTTGVWYHHVWAIDTTQATQSNRVTFYFNGTAQSPDQTNPIEQDTLTRFFLTGDTAVIGASLSYFNSPDTFFSGKLAFIQIVDGAKLTANAFGVLDGGVWKHRKHTGDFGVGGLYLPGTRGFADVHRNLSFTPVNMDGSNLDLIDLPPYVDV